MPQLRTRTWRTTRDALHGYAQVADAIRAALAPPEKHWYHVSLRAAASGLTTTPVRLRHQPVDHCLVGRIALADSAARAIADGAVRANGSRIGAGARNPQGRLLDFLRAFRSWGDF